MSSAAGGNGLLWSLTDDGVTFDSSDPQFRLGAPLPAESTDGLAAVTRGATVFRGSAVCVGDRVLGLIGPHGAGASTYAAVLVGRGHSLVVDGVVEIESDTAGIRLNNRSAHISLWGDTVKHFGFEPVDQFESGVAKFRWTPSPTPIDSEAFLNGVILVGVAAGTQSALTALDPKTTMLTLAQSQVAQSASAAIGRVPLAQAQKVMTKVPIRAVNRAPSLELAEANADQIEQWAATLTLSAGSIS